MDKHDELTRLADELQLAASAPDGPRRIEAIAAELRRIAKWLVDAVKYPADAGTAVDDAMVERACAALWDRPPEGSLDIDWGRFMPYAKSRRRQRMHSAITAALAPQPKDAT